jgi:hypothetical protein
MGDFSTTKFEFQLKLPIPLHILYAGVILICKAKISLDGGLENKLCILFGTVRKTSGD